MTLLLEAVQEYRSKFDASIYKYIKFENLNTHLWENVPVGHIYWKGLPANDTLIEADLDQLNSAEWTGLNSNTLV